MRDGRSPGGGGWRSRAKSHCNSIALAIMPSSIGFGGAKTHLFSILGDVGDGCGGEESGVVKRERALFRNWPLVERRLAALGDNPGSVPWLLATTPRRLSCRLPRL
jgi:hypothetical protein